MHGYFHQFISNRAKDMKHLRTARHFTEHCHEGKYIETHVCLKLNAMLHMHTTNGTKITSKNTVWEMIQSNPYEDQSTHLVASPLHYSNAIV